MARDAHAPTNLCDGETRPFEIHQRRRWVARPAVRPGAGREVEIDLNSRRDRVDRRNHLQEGYGSYRAWS